MGSILGSNQPLNSPPARHFSSPSCSTAVGPQHKEVMTKFGSVQVPREESFDRRTLRQSNGITNHREVMGAGVFAAGQQSHLTASLVPGRNLGKGTQVTTAARLLDSSTPQAHSGHRAAAVDYQSHHPPPSARKPEEHARQVALTSSAQPSSLRAPYAWQPNQPEATTYGFHRRW